MDLELCLLVAWSEECSFPLIVEEMAQGVWFVFVAEYPIFRLDILGLCSPEMFLVCLLTANKYVLCLGADGLCVYSGCSCDSR